MTLNDKSVWKDVGMNVVELKDVCQNRTVWRTLVAACPQRREFYK